MAYKTEEIKCKGCYYKKVRYMQAAYYYCCRQGSGFPHIKNLQNSCPHARRKPWEVIK